MSEEIDVQQPPVPVRSSDRLSSLNNNEDASTLTVSTSLYQDDMAEEEEEESEDDSGSDGVNVDEEEEEEATSCSSSGGGDGRAAAPTTGLDHGEAQQQRPQPLLSSKSASPAQTPPTGADAADANASTTSSSTPRHHHRRAASPPQPAPTYGSFLHAVTLGCLVVAMSFGINLLNLLVYLLVRPVSRVAARRVVGGVFQAMWVNVAAYLLPRSELVMTGDMPVDPTRPAIIIANHQVRVWMGVDGGVWTWV